MEISRALHSDKLLQITTQLLNELKTPRDKEILQSYFIYDKNKLQICQDLDLTAEHFDRVLFRARQRLKQLIQHKIGKTNESSKISTLLTVSILFTAFGNPLLDFQSENLIVKEVRDNSQPQHLLSETPTTNSRNLPRITSFGKPFTSKSRSV
jgi:RNA polymerase sigma-70 factor (ECF subfamily)